MDILILLTVLKMVPLIGAYEFICPSQSHWNLRAKSMCKQTTNYTCLFDINFQINVYRDRCYRPRILGPGYKYVFQPNLNRASCSVNRYQPFNFETVGYSDCTFKKSLCNSLGQKTYENADTRVDRKCICNTDRGYTFVRNSKDQCNCDPSTDDCSCYLGINPLNITVGKEDIQCYDDMKMSKSFYTEDMFNISRTIRIIEFDNYKYNLNDHLSHEYRIEAATCVCILSLAYIVIWITALRVMRLWSQDLCTPGNLNIIDYIDIQDDKGLNSESMTVQTLTKQVLPEAINHLSEKDKHRYNKLMNSSQTENRYFVRIMIVGKQSAGKTSLMRRLLKEPISDVTSTDGVDIVVNRCKINIKDGKWTIGKEIVDDKVDRIQRARTCIQNEKSKTDATEGTHRKETFTKSMQSGYESNASDKSNDVQHVSPMDTIIEGSEDRDTQNTHIDVATKDRNISQDDYLSSNKKETITDTKINLDTQKDKKESSSLVMPDDLISHVFSTSTGITSLNLNALCELWDFAGQKEFYATHQAFLTSCAVYLVVADMNENISKQGLSQSFADFEHIGEYVGFWFDSIHCHRTTSEIPRHGHFDPPILLVFTGKDKYNKADFEKREKDLNNQIDQALGYKSKYHHLHNTFYLSNTKDSLEEFEKLQYAIYETAREMDNWGAAFPLKWILLEHLIEINKNDGKHFINFTEMFKLAKHPDINIREEDELLLFLRFQHSVGNIIFFDNIRDLIILNPQWLADAFRCLVSDRVVNRRLHHLEDWTLFTRQGKISESLITKLFESKAGSQFSGQKDNLQEVMEKLDILVRIENSSYFIMPSKMPSLNFDVVCEKFGIRTEKCKRTSWLCFKFDFLPPSFFNHLSAWFIKKYPSKVNTGSALYRGICMFDIEGSGCKKILVTMSTDTIALQVLSFSELEGFGSTCSDIYSEVEQLIEEIIVRYKVTILFKLHFKCSDGYYYKDTFEFESLKSNKECFCIEHRMSHQSEQMYSLWMKKEVKRIHDSVEIGTKKDAHNSKNKPSKEVQDQISVKTNLPVSVTLRQQLNIKKSKNENILYISSCIKTGNALVFTDRPNDRLIICNSDGTDIDHIPLSYQPYYITEIDSNTVAVSCGIYRTILIIDISTRSITITLKTNGSCRGISYNDNDLYVVIDGSIIHVMDLTGKVIRTIPLPTDFIHDITVDRDRLICITWTSIYCCSLDGKVVWRFKMDEFEDLIRVTTDNERNVYVTRYKTNTVVVVSYDGKHHKELLTESDGLDEPRGIYFGKKENVLLVCNHTDGNAFLFDVIKKLT